MLGVAGSFGGDTGQKHRNQGAECGTNHVQVC
jgi:hypothetical protein